MEADISDDDGEFITDYAKILAAASRMTGDSIEIISDEKWAVITAPRTSAKLAVVPSTTMLEEPEMKREKKVIAVDVKEFTAALNATRTAMLINSSKPGCDGVQLRQVSGRLSCIGADGKRLHVVHLNTDGEIDVLIPFSAVNAIVTALDGSEGKLQISRSESAVFFSTSDIFSRMQISEQVMANIQQIVNFGSEEPDARVTIKRDPLMNAVKTAQVMAKSERGIQLRFIEGELIVTGDNASDAEIKEAVEAPDASGQLDVTLGPDYFSDMLAATVSDEITISAYSSKGAIFIKDTDRVLFMAQIRIVKTE